MNEIILFLVILSLCGLLYVLNNANVKEKKLLIHALFAKSAQDMQNMTLAEKVEIKKIEEKDKLVEPHDMTEQEFEKFIEKEVEK